jgi:hypothetical protein
MVGKPSLLLGHKAEARVTIWWTALPLCFLDARLSNSKDLSVLSIQK